MKLKELVKIPIAIGNEPKLNFISLNGGKTMKLKDILPIIYTDSKHEIVLTSPCGYFYSKDEYTQNKDKFLERKVMDIGIRNKKLRICLYPLKEKNYE